MICSMIAMTLPSQKKVLRPTEIGYIRYGYLLIYVAHAMFLCDITLVKTEFEPYLMIHTD